MSNSELGSLLFLLFVLIAGAHLLGYVFVRLRQPRVIGEILAGLLVGPSVLGRMASGSHSAMFTALPNAAHQNAQVMNFVYWLGLLLLMFVSGCETRNLFGREDRRQVAWLAVVGTGLPFLVVMVTSPWLPLERLMGTIHQHMSIVLVVGIAMAVTSIPVISKIFHDLNILHTRFARLVLGVAVIEDIGLWAVLAIATALAGSAALSREKIAVHVAVTLLYFFFGLLVAPRLLKWLNRQRWNFLPSSSPIGYVVMVLFAYSVLAALLDVSLVIAAFLAGFGVIADRERFAPALESVKHFSFAVFIPIYFAIVGYKLDLSKSFSFQMLALFLLAACVVKLLAVWLGARLAGFRGLDNLNLAVATNARGGPGIVLASVAFDAGIVNAAFYTTLVLVAVVTSQAAGAWLDYVLRRGWPLLSSAAVESEAEPEVVPAGETLAA
jgi:Kef-type K+ transport system membrane component KefB